MQDHYNRYHSGDWMGDTNFRAGVDSGYRININSLDIEVDISDYMAPANVTGGTPPDNFAFNMHRLGYTIIFADPGPAGIDDQVWAYHNPVPSIAVGDPANGKARFTISPFSGQFRSRSRYMHVYLHMIFYLPGSPRDFEDDYFISSGNVGVSLAASSSLQVRVGLAVGGSATQSFNENGAGKMQELLNSTAANNKWVPGTGFGYNPITTWPETPNRSLDS